MENSPLRKPTQALAEADRIAAKFGDKSAKSFFTMLSDPEMMRAVAAIIESVDGNADKAETIARILRDRAEARTRRPIADMRPDNAPADAQLDAV